MLDEYVKYYYLALNKEALRKKEKSVRLKKGLTCDYAKAILWAVYSDCPSFYYLDPYTIRICGYSTHSELILKYIYTDEQIKQYEERLHKGCLLFKERYITDNMSAYRKEFEIHNYLVRNIKYDYDAANHKKIVGEAYNVIGALLLKKAVCWGISLAFKLLADYCGLKCFVVIGAASASWAGDNHAWNIVKLDDGCDYHLDVTWDIKENGETKYYFEYMNLDDSMIGLDHSWNNWIYPECTQHTYNYYFRNGLFVRSLDDVTAFTEKKLREGNDFVAFKYARNKMPTAEQILNAVIEGMKKVRPGKAAKARVSPVTHNVYIEIQ